VLRLEASRIERDTPLKALGIDSLMGLELRNRLEAKLGVTLSATLVWTYPNLGALTPYLCAQFGGVQGQAQPVSAGGTAAIDRASPIPEERKQDIERVLDGLSDDELANLGEQLLGGARAAGES
jgi:acyl carrier protein